MSVFKTQNEKHFSPIVCLRLGGGGRTGVSRRPAALIHNWWVDAGSGNQDVGVDEGGCFLGACTGTKLIYSGE